MNEKKVVPLWVSIVLLLLVVASLVVSVTSLISQEIGSVSVIYVLNILINLCAAYYCLKGYSKNAAVFFKAMIICLLITTCYNTFIFGKYMSGTVAGEVKFIISILCVVLLSAFAFAKDLGKKKSLFIAIALVVLRYANYSIEFFAKPKYFLSHNGVIGFINGLVYVILLLMVIAKYKDKEARGTK